MQKGRDADRKRNLSDFYIEVESYLKDYVEKKRITYDSSSKTIIEDHIGSYDVKVLNINIGEHKVRLDPKLTYVTGVVLADSGSPFRQSVLINIGSRDGIVDGWAATDGLGLVGRISGVGRNSSRVILLTDSNSRVPVTLQPSGQRAILTGDNTSRPPLDFLESPELVRPGDRVVSSGDGGVFPPGVLVGHVALGTDGRLRVQLSADYERLEFLRILRNYTLGRVTDTGSLLIRQAPASGLPALGDALGSVSGND